MTDQEGAGISILVVDDDPQIRGALVTILATKGYEVTAAENGRSALTLAGANDPDLVVLDLGLPDMSGLKVCRDLRKFTAAPILVLTVRDSEQDKIDALDSGADDYLSKPFATGELLARMRALLRRSPRRVHERIVHSGDLAIDLEEHTVTRAGEPIRLTATEWDIIATLAERAGSVVPLKAIVRQVWGPDSETDVQLLRVHMSNLRRKIEPDTGEPHYIVTEPGVGFRLVV